MRMEIEKIENGTFITLCYASYERARKTGQGRAILRAQRACEGHACYLRARALLEQVEHGSSKKKQGHPLSDVD